MATSHAKEMNDMKPHTQQPIKLRLFFSAIFIGCSFMPHKALAELTPQTLKQDLIYYRKISARINLSSNDRLHILDRIRQKYAEGGLNLFSLDNEIARLEKFNSHSSVHEQSLPKTIHVEKRTFDKATLSESKTVESAQSPLTSQMLGDRNALLTLTSKILADPENPKPRMLLEFLLLEKLAQHYQRIQHYRKEVLTQGLNLSRELGGSSETRIRLVQAVNAINLQSPVPPVAEIPQPPDGLSKDKEKQNVIASLLREASEFLQRGQLEEAIVTLLSALTVDPSHPEVKSMLVKTLNKQSQRYQRVRKVTPRTPSAKKEKRAIDEKISFEKQAQALDHFQAGVRLYAKGQLEKAVESFRKSLKLYPNNEWAKKSLERTVVELGQKKRPK